MKIIKMDIMDNIGYLHAMTDEKVVNAITNNQKQISRNMHLIRKIRIFIATATAKSNTQKLENLKALRRK